jgi:selenoprotein W-related protein
LEEFEHDLEGVELIPSKGGVFEVEVDGQLVSSKKKTGRHADYDVVLKELREVIRP